MIPEEFKTQIFMTRDQWEKGGLSYGLEMPKEGGISLYYSPTFVKWIQEVNGILYPVALAVDECGLVYFIDADTDASIRKLYCYDPATQMLEQITYIGGCDLTKGDKPDPSPARMITDELTIWVMDIEKHRIMAFSRENYQVKYILDSHEVNMEMPVDITLNENGNLCILGRMLNNVIYENRNPVPKYQIFTYDVNNRSFIQGFGGDHLKKPIGLAAGKDNTLYVIDRNYNKFLRFNEQGECSWIGDFGTIPGVGDMKPSLITIDKKGSIFVVFENELVCQFDPEGSYTGTITLPDSIGEITGIAVDPKGSLYISSTNGIVHFSMQQSFTKEKRYYYSKTLDSGIDKCQWHRLGLKADLPPETLLQVCYYSSGDHELQKSIDKILSDKSKSTEEKAKYIDNKISKWHESEPWNISGKKNGSNNNNNLNMLFKEGAGRYLWLKIALSTFNEKAAPAITQMRVFYPRISYLRYLPAIYQEDQTSSEFLERFLSIYETVLYDLETDISQVYEYFDPDTVPQEFLTWLASWLNLALDENWPEDKKRYFIRRAFALYKIKGTPGGIKELIRIYTDTEPLIIEYSNAIKPMVLTEKGMPGLGINSILLQTPVRGFRLGDDSILGRTALRDTVQSDEDPFLLMAHRFMVILDLSEEKLARLEKGLKQILDDEKPAHTTYTLRAVKDRGLGIGTYVGKTRVTDYSPIYIGVNAAIGYNIAVIKGEQGSRLDRNSRLCEYTEIT